MDEQQIKYIHIRRPLLKIHRGELNTEWSPYGGITVAYRKIGPNQYKCAFARCNLRDKDRYNKNDGRNCARIRLREDDDVWTLDLDEGANVCKELVTLVHGIKELRRALRVEVTK